MFRICLICPSTQYWPAGPCSSFLRPLSVLNHHFTPHYVSGPRAEANKPFVWINHSELIQRDLSACRLNRVQENAMIYRRTSGLLWRNDDDDDHIKVDRRKTTSSSSFSPLLLILFHDDLFLFYWCWTSTMRSCWIAMKIPWATAPKAVKRWWKNFIYSETS